MWLGMGRAGSAREGGGSRKGLGGGRGGQEQAGRARQRKRLHQAGMVRHWDWHASLYTRGGLAWVGAFYSRYLSLRSRPDLLTISILCTTSSVWSFPNLSRDVCGLWT